MKNLYKFSLSIPRFGTLEGFTFLTQDEYVDCLGLTGIACDVLGKHSEVEFTVTDKNLTLVTDNQDLLDAAEKVGINLQVGFQFRDYLEEEYS